MCLKRGRSDYYGNLGWKKDFSWFPAHFSKGMRQKVMIMCAFLVNPSLYIIDEPFVGLDPIGIKSLFEQMTEEKEKGLPFSCQHMSCLLRKNIATGSSCCTKAGCEQKERWMTSESISDVLGRHWTTCISQ